MLLSAVVAAQSCAKPATVSAARDLPGSATGARTPTRSGADLRDEAPTPPKARGNPLAGKRLWVDPDSLAALRVRALEQERPALARLFDVRIARQPQAVWLGSWNADVYRAARYVADRAAERGEVPVFVLYNLPGRDCARYSIGARGAADAYRRWVRRVATAIEDRNAIIVLEPDALGLLESKDCLSDSEQKLRLVLLHDAIQLLRQNPLAVVYLDGGHSRWHPLNVHARLLELAGVRDAHGFALNTGNFRALEEILPFGRQLSALLGGAHFVIDTSRNGAGPYGIEWCNPPGRKLGKAPSTHTGEPLVDAFLWLKRPGESDGECNGGPRVGVFWDRAALELVR